MCFTYYSIHMTKELAVILYVLSKFPEWLYQTLLYKYLFYIDFYSFSVNNKSLTDAIYYKLPYWPVPLAIKEKMDIFINNDKDSLESLPDEQKLFIEQYKDYIIDNVETSDIIKHRLQISKDVELPLSDSEKQLIDNVFNKLSSKLGKQINEISTKDMVNISHQEKAYIEAEWWQPMFYWFCDDLSIV